MKSTALGAFIMVHAFAHAAAGTWVVADGQVVVRNAIWAIATIGYLGAAMGVFRMPKLRNWWRHLFLAATIASVVLLILVGNVIAFVGIGIDVVLLLFVSETMMWNVSANVRAAKAAGVDGLPHPLMHRIGWTCGALVLAYVSAVALLRPVYLQWGTNADERAAVLPGDERTPNARYRVDHAISIRAPVDSVWPWLAQVGQDRAGFYSYSRLERFFGDRIENADRIHPEWQAIAVGDTIRATQPDYLGGHLGQLGWRVVAVEPRRAIVLENWGAFVLEPRDSLTTRLIVRTRGPGTRSLTAFLLAPVSVFVMEPAHFIMQRGMLRGIRDRAEHRGAST
jgi:hypothetical protein